MSICPECRNAKHVNCDGRAWDDATDQPTNCTCAECEAVEQARRDVMRERNEEWWA